MGKRVPFVTSPILGRPGCLIDRERHGTGDKDNKSVNGTRIFHWEVSTGKTGLPFQEFRLFRKISSGTTRPEFPEFFGKWKTLLASLLGPLDTKTSLKAPEKTYRGGQIAVQKMSASRACKQNRMRSLVPRERNKYPIMAPDK